MLRSGRPSSDRDRPRFPVNNSLFFSSLDPPFDWSVHAFIPSTYCFASVYSAVSSPAARPCRASATINTHLHTLCTPLPAEGDKGVGAVCNCADEYQNKFVRIRAPVSRWLNHFHLRDSGHANRELPETT